jgi:hypothetical protein
MEIEIITPTGNKNIVYSVEHQGCWISTIKSKKYPLISVGGKVYIVSRLMYRQFKGDIGEGLVIRHTCDNCKCINPEHLIEGTQAENMLDMVLRGRAKGKGQGNYTRRKKLSTKTVLQIKKSTESTVKIAQKYGVSCVTVNKVKNNTYL